MVISYNEWKNINEGKIIDFFKNLVKKTSFNADVEIWFDILRNNHKQWEYTPLKKIVAKEPVKEHLDELERFLRTESKKTGATELLDFIKKINKGQYKKEYPIIEGDKGIIEEFFNLIKQAIEY